MPSMFSKLWVYNKVYNRTVFRMLPGMWRATFDLLLFRKILEESLGLGPLNGQMHRQKIVCEILTGFPIEQIIETGTYRGVTTRFFYDNFEKDIFTVEKNEQFFHYSRLRMKKRSRAHFFNDDSVSFLEKHISSDAGHHKGNHILFYLDAHWEYHLPLLDELKYIFEYYQHPIIIIDDFQVPGDLGYNFDDYGNEKKICLKYLDGLNGMNFYSFFPSLNSKEETGSRRGCAVLVSSRSDAEIMKNFTTLRFFDRT